MSLDKVVSARIHPAIGIARIGNSETGYFIGPEVPHPVPAPAGGYKDEQGKLKRQGAQFRVFGYDAAGSVVAELTAPDVEITWNVEVANKKASWYDFLVALDIPEAINTQAPRRNSWVGAADRHKLNITPEPQSIRGANQRSNPFTGQFFDKPVYLGEMQTDAAGRLLFLGGRGDSGSPFPHMALTTFANNAGWHDDVCDGPVTATVKTGHREIVADPAWVVVAPPNYGPDIVTVQTMYDVIYDALTHAWITGKSQPSFMQDIYPLLHQFSDAQWVNAGFLTDFGWGAPYEFLRTDMLEKLAAPGDQFKEVRRHIFKTFRDPSSTKQMPLQWPALYGDAFGNFDDSPRVYFAVTSTIYGYLKQWFDGEFDADYDPDYRPPQSLADVPLAQQPETLDRAALHFCMGGPFHPGCEMTWPMRNAQMYRAPFRLIQAPSGVASADYGDYLTQAIATAYDGPLSQSAAGDITRWMAIPWQADTASCRSGYNAKQDPYLPSFWLSRVPNQVLSEDDYKIAIDTTKLREKRIAAFNTRQNWLRGLDLDAPPIPQITKMVSDFGELGVVEKRPGPSDGLFPPDLYVETQATIVQPAAPNAAAPAKQTPAEEARVSPAFVNARFGGRARR